MVRATTAEVLKMLGGSYPTGWDATAVGNLCDAADNIIDTYTYPETLSTTDSKVVQIANEVVLRLIQRGNLMHQSGGVLTANGNNYPANIDPLSKQQQEQLDRLLMASYDPVASIDMQGENSS